MKIKNTLRKIGVSTYVVMSVAVIAQATPKLFVPSHPQPKAPLFVSLHGCLSDANDAEQSTRMSEYGEQYGFYVYYPEPILGADSKGCFDFYTDESQKRGGGDAAAVVAQIQTLLNSYDIDKEKIFVVGMSGGASLVSVLTSCYPDVIKGAAIHSGMGYGLASTWQESLLVAQTGPLPLRQRNTSCRPQDYNGKMFLIHGSADQVMNPRHFSALEEDYFSNTKTTSSFTDSQSNIYGYYTYNYYRNHQLKGKSVYVMGMNHEWSGSEPLLPFSSKGPNVSEMIVHYFLEANH